MWEANQAQGGEFPMGEYREEDEYAFINPLQTWQSLDPSPSGYAGYD